jgi:hypothetical protein
LDTPVFVLTTSTIVSEHQQSPYATLHEKREVK